MSRKKFGDIKNKVKMLTSGDFERGVLNEKELYTIMFYADWCGHCQRAKPIYSKISNLVCCQSSTGAVDCEAQKQLVNDLNNLNIGFKITGYPTFVQFKNGKFSRTYDAPSSDGTRLLKFITGVHDY
jgi:thiol-disulfide isomerase/thioredoxin